MKEVYVSGLIERLQALHPDAKILLEDLNGLHWILTEDVIRIENGDLVLGRQDINHVSGTG